MKKRIFLFLFCFSSVFFFGQQTQWTLSTEKATSIAKKHLMPRKNMPKEYKIYNLKEHSFKAKITKTQKSKKQIIAIPTANGLQQFFVKETSNFAEELSKKYTNIKSFSGFQIDNPTVRVKFSVGLDGYHFLIYEKGKPMFYVESFTRDHKKVIAYYRNSIEKEVTDFKCQVKEFKKQSETALHQKQTNDGLLRTYKLAVATTGEYSQFQLTRLGISTAASTSVKKEAVLSAINTTINKNNTLFERDLSIKFQLVANNDEIIFLDAATDNLTNDNPESLIDDSQSTIDATIGNSNYDIGHTFSTGAGGLAGLGVVCVSGQKAKGVTGISAPFGDEFDFDFVAHELGHQFGANHTFNGTVSNCTGGNRNNATAVEPGSGSTIMAYAGLCAPQNIQNDSDEYFHSVSIAEIRAIVLSSGDCAATESNGNTAPVADAGLDYSIPKSTPFVLKGNATDAEGIFSLTYNWEQIDTEIGFSVPPSSTSTGGPMFRSLPPKTISDRYFPELKTVIAGNTSTEWEVLPSVARDLNFSLLVRDNNATGGATSRDDVTVTVTNSDPFLVTSQNTPETWGAGSNKTITWNKSTTDLAPINCQNVDIKLSIDGGITFPITLISATPNDGSEVISVPNNVTDTARIMVAASDHIFYNVNAANIIIESTEPSFILSNTSGKLSACNTGDQSVSYVLDVDFINGFSETVSFSSTGQPEGATVVFNPTTLNSDGNVTMTISNLNDADSQEYVVKVAGNSASVNQNLDTYLGVTASSLNPVNLSTPIDTAAEVSIVETLSWQEEVNAASYDVEIATDNNFTNIIANGNVTSVTYKASNLEANTTYYWRVKAKNSCNESAFSNPFSFTTETPSYCLSTFTDEAGGSEHITNVTFNEINQNSGNDTFDGYEDFTSVSTNVKRGDIHQVSVTLDTGGFQDHVYVFIDWNRDYVFNKTTERYDLGLEIDDVGTKTFNITVPNDAVFGKTTMRVVIEYRDPTGGAGDGPCDADHQTEWGETEDYSVTIVAEDALVPDNISVQTTSETCVDENDGIITVSVKQPSFNYNITISNNNTNINSQISGFNEVFSNLSPGVYQVCIEVVQFKVTQCFEVEIKASEPISLTAKANKAANTYLFNIASGTAPYSVFLNDELLQTFKENIFEIEIHKEGKLEVKTAKECEGVYKLSTDAVLLLQNPVIDTIELLVLQNPVINTIDLVVPLENGNPEIEALIYDINGKLILKKTITLQNNVMSIPFRNFAKGLYFLKLPIEAKPIKILKQ